MLTPHLKYRSLLIIAPHFKYFIRDSTTHCAPFLKEVRVLMPLSYLYNISRTIPLIKRLNAYIFNPQLEKEDPWNSRIIYAKFITLPKLPEIVNLYLATKSSINTIMHQKRRFDLIHAHFLSCGYIGALIKDRWGAPLILTLHGHDVYSTPFKLGWSKLSKFTFYYADHIITVSHFNAKHLLSLGIPRNKISVIYNGFNEDIFKPFPKELARSKLGLPSKKKMMVSVASLVPAKGHMYLIDAMKIVSQKRDDVVLFIIGSGPLFRKLNKKIKNCNLKGKVFIVGRREHKEISLWINACDIFVLPSLREGFPTVIPEVMACGKPVIATNVGGIPEAVISNDLGTLVDPKDPKALASAILEALEKKWDPEVILKYSKKYCWKNLARQIIRIYQKVL